MDDGLRHSEFSETGRFRWFASSWASQNRPELQQEVVDQTTGEKLWFKVPLVINAEARGGPRVMDNSSRMLGMVIVAIVFASGVLVGVAI